MNTPEQPPAPRRDSPELDLRQIEESLASSFKHLGEPPTGFRLIREVGRNSEPQLVDPMTLAATSDDLILVLDRVSLTEFQVVRFTADGDCDGVSATIPVDEREGLRRPSSLSVNADGELFISDSDLNAVVKFSGDGRWLEAYRTVGGDAGGFHHPRDADLDGAGRIHVADTYHDRIVRLSPQGSLEMVWSDFRNPFTGDEDDGLYEPSSVCVAEDGAIYIADANNHRVLAFRGSELIAQWSGSGLFEFPSEVRLTRDGRTLLIGDCGNLRVRKFRVALGLQDASGCLGTLSLLPGSDEAEAMGGGDIDVLSSGYVTLVNPRRQAVAILDFLDQPPKKP